MLFGGWDKVLFNDYLLGWLNSVWVLLVLSASVLTCSLISILEDAADLYKEPFVKSCCATFPAPLLPPHVTTLFLLNVIACTDGVLLLAF